MITSTETILSSRQLFEGKRQQRADKNRKQQAFQCAVEYLHPKRSALLNIIINECFGARVVCAIEPCFQAQIESN